MEGEEISSGSLGPECSDVNLIENESEAMKNDEAKVEDPKRGMIFNTREEGYLYYSRYAKQKGFGVAIRSSKKNFHGYTSWQSYMSPTMWSSNVPHQYYDQQMLVEGGSTPSILWPSNIMYYDH